MSFGKRVASGRQSATSQRPAPAMAPSGPPSFMSYHVTFFLVLLGIDILIAVLRMVWDVGGLSGVSMAAPFIASTFVADRFIRAERRAPDNEEAGRLVLGGLLCYLGLNLIFMLLALVGLSGQAEANTAPLGFVFFGLILFLGIGAAIAYFMMRWSYRGLARKRALKLGYGAE